MMNRYRTDTVGPGQGEADAGQLPADAVRLRHFCHAVLDLLDRGAEGGRCPLSIPTELTRVISSGVGAIAEGLRSELAAWDGAIADVRQLFPARYLRPTPTVTALLAELEATRSEAARVVATLEALRESPADVPPDPPAAPGATRPAIPIAPVFSLSPQSESAEPTPHQWVTEPDPSTESRPGDTAEAAAAEPTRESPPAANTEGAAGLFRRAQRYQKRQEFERAEELYSEVIRIDPRFGPAYSRRGQIRIARGAIAAALVDFDTALDLDDTAAEAWWWRGDARAIAGRVEEAVADYTRALTLRPDLVRARFNLGVALKQMGDTGRARDEFTRVIETRPGHSAAYLNRGLIHLQRGSHDQAKMDFQAALRYDPECESARQHLEALRPPVAAKVTTAPAPPASGERPGLAKKEASSLSVNCPSCDHPGEISWDRLGKVFACGSCRRRFGVRSDGTTVELVNTPDGKWVERPKVRERARLRRKRRLAVAGVVLAGLLFPAIGAAGWRAVRPAAEPAERELPRELAARAELFAQAWLSNDVRLMRRLTSPANERAVYAWYTRHRPPSALRPPTDGTLPDGARIEVAIRPGKPGQSVARVQVSSPKVAPDQAPVELSLVWEERGEDWYFLPPPK